MTALSVIAIFSSGASGGQSEREAMRLSAVHSVSYQAGETVPRSECPHAHKGLRFYVRRYGEHAARMGAAVHNGSSGQRAQPRSMARGCPLYLANVWKRKSFAMRMRVERFIARQIAREKQHPKWIALRLLKGDREQWGCLMYIVSVENARMLPTLDFGGGHGNVYEAYGIPQANPGTKMASHGPDWRTNPETQLRWMIDYCNDRYGSLCGAAYARRTRGWY